MRNRGLSDAVTDTSKISLQHDADDLKAVRAHFGVEQPDLIGFSYLGKIVVLYAIQHPDHVNRIVQLGPVARKLFQIQTNLGDLYQDAHQVDRAIEQYRKVVEMDPNFANVRFKLGGASKEKGMYREAAAEWHKANLLENDPEGAAAWENVIDEASFRRAAARYLAHLKELSKRQYVSPIDLAHSALDVQDKEQALVWLEEAYRERTSGLRYLKMSPAWDPLRSDPRFQDPSGPGLG